LKDKHGDVVFSSYGFVRGDNTTMTSLHPVSLYNNIFFMERTGGGSSMGVYPVKRLHSPRVRSVLTSRWPFPALASFPLPSPATVRHGSLLSSPGMYFI
jgi:hypothetical protein